MTTMAGLICTKCDDFFSMQIICGACKSVNEVNYNDTTCKVCCRQDFTHFLSTWICESCKTKEERDLKAAINMFCPHCGTLAFPKPDGSITCTNYRCGYSNSFTTSTREIVQTNSNFDINNELIYGTEISAYFIWPSTEIKPTRWVGLTDVGFSDSPDKSPLSELGYKVGKSGIKKSAKRRKILDHVFLSEKLPFVQSRDYMMQWGAAKSPKRLKKIANFLAATTRNWKRQSSNYELAISHRIDDLVYLKMTYYDGKFDGSFSWPSTDNF